MWPIDTTEYYFLIHNLTNDHFELISEATYWYSPFLYNEYKFLWTNSPYHKKYIK